MGHNTALSGSLPVSGRGNSTPTDAAEPQASQIRSHKRQAVLTTRLALMYSSSRRVSRKASAQTHLAVPTRSCRSVPPHPAASIPPPNSHDPSFDQLSPSCTFAPRNPPANCKVATIAIQSIQTVSRHRLPSKLLQNHGDTSPLTTASPPNRPRPSAPALRVQCPE